MAVWEYFSWYVCVCVAINVFVCENIWFIDVFVCVCVRVSECVCD